MIQELYFAPHSVSRAQNQMNTSVTLRYDTKTQKLQLIDVFGKVKSISIDTDPDDLTMDNLYQTITTDFIKGLGFETAEEAAAKLTTIEGGYGIGVNTIGVNNTVYIKKSVINDIAVQALSKDESKEKIWDSFTFTDGVASNSGTVTIDENFLDNYMNDRGFVPGDNDTLYHQGEGLVLTIEDTNTFSVDKDWLSGFLGTYLTDNQYVNTKDSPVSIAAGEGISVEVQEQGEGLSANVISLTAHIPTGIVDIWEAQAVKDDISGLGFIQLADVPIYTGVEGIAVDNDNKLISLTAYIPTGLNDFSADDTSAYIRGQGFALTGELSDTLYYADNNSLALNTNGNIFSINQQWLSTFVQSFGYLTEDVDTTYTGSNSINIDNDNSISINTTWLGEAVAPMVVSNITTTNGANAVKSVVTSTYISGLGFVLANEQKDTTYSAKEDGGLILTSTSFSIDIDWLNATTDTFVDNKITSAYIADLGVKITDTIVSQGLGIEVEADANNPQIQMVSVNPDWISGQISAYNEEHRINPTYSLIAGNGIAFTDNEEVGTRTISLIPTIPSKISDLQDDTLSAYLKIEDYVDNNTEYTAGEGLKLDGTEFSLTAAIPSIDGLASETFVNEAIVNLSTSLVDELSGDENTTYYADEETLKLTVEQGTEQLPDRNVFSVNTTWLDGVIEGKGYLVAGDLTGYAQLSDIPVVPTGLASWETSANTNYIAGLGFVLAGDDKDTKYGVVEQGGLTVNVDHNFAIDTNWMDNRLSGYALKSELPVVPSAVSEFENDANYATVDQLPTKVSDLSNDKSFVTVAELEAIRLSLLEQFANITSVTEIDGNVNAPTQNLFIDTDSTLTANTSFVGKSITVNSLSNEDSYTKFTSTGDIVLNNLTSNGTLPKAQSNAQIIANTPNRVTITDAELNQNGYNAIEIGLDSSIEPPKSVLVDGVEFNGNLSNNAITIFGTADDAVITISNCKFVKVSNALRISNRTNTKVTVNIVNCQFTEWQAPGDYAGMILCQDYTSSTADAAETANRFAPDKVTINISNCTHAGTKIEFSDPATVCGSKDANQILYVYRDKGGLVAYDPAKYPTISVN